MVNTILRMLGFKKLRTLNTRQLSGTIKMYPHSTIYVGLAETWASSCDVVYKNGKKRKHRAITWSPVYTPEIRVYDGEKLIVSVPAAREIYR